VFISGLTPAMAAETVADIRARAARHGRRRSDLLIFNGLCVITAPSDQEARAKADDYKSHIDLERMLTLFSGYTGIDFSGWDPDTRLDYFESNAIQTFVEIFTRADPGRVWTLREVARFLGLGGFAPIEVGSPQTIAARMAHWMEAADLDGFNLVYVVAPGDVESFVATVVPELQRQGRYKTAYEPGGFREKLFGPGRSRLPDTHPATRFRVPTGSRRGASIARP
jgi:alkanesulfonate monooxygenase